MPRQVRHVWVMLVVIGTIAACNAGPGPTVAVSNSSSEPTAMASSTAGGQVTEAVAADAVSFGVYKTTDATSRLYQFMVYASGLWRRDPTTNLPMPYMAESWTQSQDGKTFTFKLRQDMKWSDGVAITAQDFVWTYEQAANPANNYPYVSILKDIVSYTAPDDHTVQVTLGSGSCVGILTAGQITPLPKHVWDKFDWSDASKNPEINAPSVVSGPWKLQRWDRDNQAVFVRNASYFGGVPSLDSFVVRVVPDSSVRQQLLQSGQVDYAAIPATGFASAKANSNLTLYQWDPAQPTWYFLGLNLRQAQLQDVELRRALARAIPKATIADRLFNGLAKPMDTTYSPASWAYTPSVTKYDYDIAVAGNELTQAGYRLDDQGRRLDKSGKPITMRLYAPSGDSIRDQIAEITQQQLGMLGIGVQITTLESQALFQLLTTKTGDWEMWVGLSRDTSDPNFAGQTWNSQTIPQLNVGAYVNPQVDQLYATGNQPPCDLSARQPVYQQISETIASDVPYVFLVYNTGFAFVNKQVVVNPPSPLGIDYHIEQWSRR